MDMQATEWLAAQISALTTKLDRATPSQWAERHRYLPASVTSMPGFFRFAVAPYLREPLDCLSSDSPVREVAVMKGVQICATVGILENAIGYAIGHIKTAPVMMVTADAELALLRLESNITPMLQHSGLADCIKSTDEGNNRKSGKTNKKVEWVGGGYLIPFGAQNANKLRSVSIQLLLRDEIDGWPDVVGKDGDPIKLSFARTAAYEHSRKVLDLSTPLLKGSSKIHAQFLRGDQRYYFVKCLNPECRHPQVLRWKHTDPDTGEGRGLTWETKGGRLVPGSVRYLCQACGHPHTNDDKTRLLADDNAEWRPTAESVGPHVRSYHISALYSPVGMQTWESLVHIYRDAWCTETNRCKSVPKLQVFYNNVWGVPFEERGKNLRLSTVAQHRRTEYAFGEVPNLWAKAHCDGPILLLTCSVDIHSDNLAVAVFGWTRGRRAILIDYWRWEGDPEQLDDPGTWGKLAALIETPERYVADDGASYPIGITFVDSGYLAQQAYAFADGYEIGVHPIKGRDSPIRNARIKEFAEFKTQVGPVGVTINVDLYKERYQAVLAKSWDGHEVQPAGHFNAPRDTSDRQLKELTVESKRPRECATTGRDLGSYWHRPPGSANELWDLLVYAAAALDFVAWDIAIQQMEQETLVWDDFWNFIEREQVFFSA